MRLFKHGLVCAGVALLIAGCAPATGSGTTVGAGASEAPEDVAAIRSAAIPLAGTASDYDPLIRSATGTTRVLLGESTHGTHEFYRDRALLTQRLIADAGFNAIAIEGDWSPTYRANLYVRGIGTDRSAREALRGFTRYPFWMWPNEEFAAFLEELRTHNQALPAGQRVGLYGMDVYDLYEAADFVVESLEAINGTAARRVREQYRCFSR